jgi:hypothetical protein
MAIMGRIGTAAAVIVLEKAPQPVAENPLSADQNALFFVAPFLANTRSVKPASSIPFSWEEWLLMAF